jgi:hypothetical protein
MNFIRSELQQLSMACNYKSDNTYDPRYDRQYPEWRWQDHVAIREIDIGEEILDNYICYDGSEDILENVDELQDLCGGAIGFVTQYETTHT